MRSVAARVFSPAGALTLASTVLAGVVLSAQSGAVPADPRVGLKAGLTDAGEAAWNMERVASLPKPDGFFDPKQPAGAPTPPETPEPAAGAGGNAPAAAAGTGPANAAAAAGQPSAPQDPAAQAAAEAAREAAANRLGFANSDLAFAGNLMYAGNYHGFNIYDIEVARKPRLLASVVCPGGQGDVSIRGNLLIMSVEQTRGRLDCGLQGVRGAVNQERFRGVRIFDISDIRNPKQVAAVQTCRGSHTHTLIADPDDRQNLYIYGSGTSAVRSGDELSGCSNKDPKEDPSTSLFSIDVIQVPLAAPEKARIVSQPRIFADPSTGAISGLWQGGNHGAGTQTARVTNQCHDITVYPEIGLAAGACSGNGILLDISDPVNPVRLDAVVDKGFAYWHSATFSNDGRRVVFTDEWGGGTRPRCRSTDPAGWGANAIFDIVDRKLQLRGYYKMPAAQTDTENCVAHNGSIIPVPGRDLMVQAWYQGGISVFDFGDPAKPVEIAYFDRGPISDKDLVTGGFWSAYWYNGFVYGSEIVRGVDVFRLTPSQFLTQNEIDAATQAQTDELNVQQQKRVSWPASSVVARAYVDQLSRTNGLRPQRITDVRAALTRADDIRSPADRGAAAAIARLDTLARQIDGDAKGAGADGAKLRSLAETLRGIAARLRA
jgi:hypothetical protein